MTHHHDGIAVGDMFDAFVQKGPGSKNVIGQELCDKGPKKAHFSPEIAIAITRLGIETETSTYSYANFTFRKVPD